MPSPQRTRKRSKGSFPGRGGGPRCSGRALALFSFVGFSWGLFFFMRVAGPDVAPALLEQVGAGANSLVAAAVGSGSGVGVGGGGEDLSLREWNEVPADDRFYLVFSTDCTGYQTWQSLAIFFSADEVRQPGTIVRIASGCTEAQQKEVQTLYDQFPTRFQVHFTPDFKKDTKSGKSYDFYNKPYGLEHWLDSKAAPPEDAIVALLDPDFLFLRPLTYKINSDTVLFSPTITEADLIDEVTEGHPVAQHYGIGSHWTKFKVGYIAGEDSPARKVSISDAYRDYSVGPPYIVHVKDMRKIAKKWAECVPKVYEEYPELLAEMYAYSIAAAHLQLPHLRLDHYMISNIDASGEGWPFVDRLEETYVCGDYPDLGTQQPVFLHYCQFYRVEHWGFHKRRVDEHLFSCEAPLFLLPPEDLEDTHWKEDPYKKTLLSQRQAQHAAFSLCNIVKKLNRAGTKYKNLFCPAGTANYTQAVKIW